MASVPSSIAPYIKSYLAVSFPQVLLLAPQSLLGVPLLLFQLVLAHFAHLLILALMLKKRKCITRRRKVIPLTQYVDVAL